MAGRRMHVNEYVEISAVCTHPDHTGKGYGKSLINNQLRKIAAEGSIPFLHVRADNEHAINLYKHLGFTVRSELNIYIIRKEE
jgi:predicted GNAT family acetyltransferase